MAGAGGWALTGCGATTVDRPVRQGITSARDVQAYTTAVGLVKALPPADPRSWNRQVQLHSGRCRHASWLFFPWHRAYLYYFEEICRSVLGDPTFALPYWDWTTHPQIPAAFLDPTSPLYVSGREAPPGAAAGSAFVGPAAVEAILAEPNFLLFAGAPTIPDDPQHYGPGYGLVEQSLHNYVHGFVGGVMSTLGSPADPLFWTHHNRIDQLWAQWSARPGHPHPVDEAWWGTEFTDFVDGGGHAVTVSVRDTVTMPLRDYRFEEAV